MKDRPGYRSYSQLTEWMKCGESYRLSRRVGIKERPSWWLPGGTAFHNTTERYDLGTLTNGSITQTWAEEWDRAVQAQADNAPEGYRDTSTWRAAGRGKEGAEFWLISGPKWCEDYADWRDFSALQLVEAGVEAEVNAVLGGVRVRMFVDRIFVDANGQALIVDLKTGASKQPSTLQLGTYKVGIAKTTGLDAEWGAFYDARKGELLPPMRLDQWTEASVGGLFATFDEQENAGQYLPNIGFHCQSMCSMREWCVYQGGQRHPEDEGE